MSNLVTDLGDKYGDRKTNRIEGHEIQTDLKINKVIRIPDVYMSL